MAFADWLDSHLDKLPATTKKIELRRKNPEVVHPRRRQRLAKLVPYMSMTCPSPFPLSRYAMTMYGFALCNWFLLQIQVCEHGWTCGKCCHIYGGKTIMNEGNYPKVLFGDEKIPLVKLVVYLFFDLWSFVDRISIRHICEEILCVNIHHLTFNRFSAKDVETLIHFYTQYCVHGYNCEVCCWWWLGPFEDYLSPILAFNQYDVIIQRYLYTKYFHQKIPRDPHIEIMQTCGNKNCVNYRHVYLRKINIRDRKKNLENTRH